MLDLEKARGGINNEVEDWLEFNHTGAFSVPGGLSLVAPFPPPDLMQWVSGLVDHADFAKSGCDIFAALSLACPTPLHTFESILDFGIGVGRLARMFKGFRGRYAGVDVDARHITWITSALDYVEAFASEPKKRLPFPDKSFDCIISVSVFTHMNERDQFFYLKELARLAKPGATLLLTTHGERALARAETERGIFEMLTVPAEGIAETRRAFSKSGFNFIRQHRDLNAAIHHKVRTAIQEFFNCGGYEYGITFISEAYVRRKWSKYFDIVRFCPSAIHDFQDIVVLKAPQ